MISSEVLKQRIIERFDPDYLVDVLRITSEELVDRFEDKVVLYRHEFFELEDEQD